jgi:Cu-processing system ATP-binding protein
MLEIAGLRKSFDRRRVLDGLDLSVAAGEAVALLGRNGSGKTTTLRCIAGLTLPDAGRIEVEGRDVLRQGPESRQLLSHMPQRSVFPPTLRVRETVSVVARLRGVPSSRVESELAACGLEPSADLAVGALSGGQRQRLGLAIAFLPDVPLYLFDEPSANLDDSSLEVFRRRTRALVREGRAVLFTTHSREDVDTMASRVVRLEEGRRAGSEAARRTEAELELVIEVGSGARPWIETALALGARTAWAQGTRLYFRGPLTTSVALLERLAAARPTPQEGAEAACASAGAGR